MITTVKKHATVMCLQETWLEPGADDMKLIENEQWSQKNVCLGRGRGLTTFYQKNFQWTANVSYKNFQLTMIQSEDFNLINVYRSSDAITSSFLAQLTSLLEPPKHSLIVGDFNLCYLSERSHPIFKFLEARDFYQMVENPTHIGGRMIDLVFSNNSNLKCNVYQKAHYFTDHDILEIR